MKKYSIWLEYMKTNEPTLIKDITCDVLIIGAGMTGVSTAYHLKNQNLNIVVVDKNKAGHGISARTTGKLTYLQDIIISNILPNRGEKIAEEYIHSQQEAINLAVDIIRKNQIECNLQKVSSYLFSKETLIKEQKFLKKCKIPFQKTKTNGINVIQVNDTYVFHPVKYILALKEICKKAGIHFYEHTDINFFKKENGFYICGNELVKIKTKKVIFASHYPYFFFPYLMPLKCTIEKSYLSASLVKEIKFDSAISTLKPVTSIRFYQNNNQNYFIYLKGSHTFTEYQLKEHFDELTDSLNAMNVRPKYLWSNHDIMTFDKLPFIGKLEGELYLATGYNTWGMTNGNLAGKIIADMILGKRNVYESLFSPHRKFQISSLPNTIYGGIKPMIDTKLWKKKCNEDEHVYFETRNGKKLAIYVDKFGKEHIVHNICPHLKCSLIFNSVEKTWDCPCHGSRFDLDGKVIIGPSNYNITYHG